MFYKNKCNQKGLIHEEIINTISTLKCIIVSKVESNTGLKTGNVPDFSAGCPWQQHLQQNFKFLVPDSNFIPKSGHMLNKWWNAPKTVHCQ